MDNEELKAGNGDDDSEKLTFWKTRKNSLSDRLFQYFEVKSKSNYGTTLYVQCILCDPNKPLLSVTTGINSNLKTHLDRVSTHFGRFCYQPQLTDISIQFTESQRIDATVARQKWWGP